MKKRILLALLALTCISPVFAQPQSGSRNNYQAGQIKWLVNYREAVAQAKQQNKPLFLFFTGSDWCGWCKKMEQEIFSSPDFYNGVGNSFVFVDVDFPMKKPLPPEIQQQNNDLKQRFGISGYPTVVILDSNQNFVAEVGYRPGGGKAYADYLKQYLQQ